MSKHEIVDVLCEVARRAAAEANATHPEDIAIAMMNAIEAGAITLDVMRKRERQP